MTRRADRLRKNPVGGLSPASRQAIRDRAEAAALLEVEKEAERKREITEKLRKQRLAVEAKSAAADNKAGKPSRKPARKPTKA